MATFTKPNIYTYYSNAAIPANVFVKLIDNDSIGIISPTHCRTTIAVKVSNLRNSMTQLSTIWDLND